MLIEVWSDVVCPWCYIGKQNLELALAGFAEDVEVKHRAFQLDPGAQEARSTLEMLGERYGKSQVQAMQERVTEVAAKAGLSFKLAATMSGNTLDAHRLLLWAQENGDAQPLLAAMFSAYFEEEKSIFSREALVDIAVAAGYSRELVEPVLASDAFATEVHADQADATAFGANGVPFFVFDRKYGVSGAQPVEVFSQVLVKASS